MLAVRLDADLEQRLTAVAKRTGRSKSYYAREAIRDKIEELEDLAAAEAALRNYDAAQNISIEQMRHELGLES
jgi:RHH-type transcriptional regulator, rel operon repressor / antitoxin RelB